MYYKCKIYPTDVVIYVNENNFDVIVDHVSSASSSLLVLGYLTEEEVKDETSNCYVELKCIR